LKSAFFATDKIILGYKLDAKLMIAGIFEGSICQYSQCSHSARRWRAVPSIVPINSRTLAFFRGQKSVNPGNFPSTRIAIHNQAGGSDSAHSFSRSMVTFRRNDRQNIGLATTSNWRYRLGPQRTPRSGTERPLAVGSDYWPPSDCCRPCRVTASGENAFGSAINELTAIVIVTAHPCQLWQSPGLLYLVSLLRCAFL